MSQSNSWLAKKKRPDGLSTPRLAPFQQVTIVEDDLNPSAIFNHGSTESSGSRVSTTTSNNREEFESPRPIGSARGERKKDYNEMLRLLSTGQPVPPQNRTTPRFARRSLECRPTGSMMSPRDNTHASLKALRQENRVNGFGSTQEPRRGRKGSDPIPRAKGPHMRKVQSDVHTMPIKDGPPGPQRPHRPYIGERRTPDIGIPEKTGEADSLAVDSQDAATGDEPPAVKYEAEDSDVSVDTSSEEASDASGTSITRGPGFLYEGHGEEMERLIDTPRSGTPYTSASDGMESDEDDELGPLQYPHAPGFNRQGEGAGRAEMNIGGGFGNRGPPALRIPRIPMESEVLQDRIGSPMPEDFYKTAVMKAKHRHYSNEIFESAKKFLKEMTSEVTASQQPPMKSPFSSLSNSRLTPEPRGRLSPVSQAQGRGIPSTAGTKDREKLQIEWRELEHSHELQIEPKPEPSNPGFLKYPIPNEEEVYAREGVRKSPMNASGGLGTSGQSKPPLPAHRTPPRVCSPSPQVAAEESLHVLASREGFEGLMQSNGKFRHFVKNLQLIARTGSIRQVQKALGMVNDDGGNYATDYPRSSLDTLYSQSSGPSQGAGQAPTLESPRPMVQNDRGGTVYYDCENGVGRSQERTMVDPKNQSGRFLSSPVRGASADGGKRSEIYDENTLTSCGDDMADVAHKLRNVIQEKSAQLDQTCRTSNGLQRASMDNSGSSAGQKSVTSPPEKPKKPTRKSPRLRHDSDPSAKTGGFHKKLLTFFRKSQFGSQGGSYSARNSQLPPGSLAVPGTNNYIDDEIASVASFYNAVAPVMEPSGSSSCALPPHPLQDAASIRLMMGTPERVTPEPMDTTPSSAGGSRLQYAPSEGSNAGSTIEERYYMLKLNIQMMNGSGDSAPLTSRTEYNPSARQQPKKSMRAMSDEIPAPAYREQAKTPEKPIPLNLAVLEKDIYIPTNDVTKILTTTKKDVKMWRGPLDDWEFQFLANFRGKWKVDWNYSDSYESLCKVMNLGWVFRKGMEASDCLEFRHTRSECRSVAKVVNLVNLTERRPWVGTVVAHRRRDQRAGPSNCWVERYDGGFVMRMDWEEPLAGTSYEFVELTADHTRMVVRQDLYRKTGNLSAHSRIVFNRMS